MDLDDDYAPGSPSSSEVGTTGMNSSRSSDGLAHQEPPPARGHEFSLPMRPATPGSEDPQGAISQQEGVLSQAAGTIAKTSRKRRRSDYSTQGEGADAADSRGAPLKRQKSYLNTFYIKLLNTEVKDIAEGWYTEHWSNFSASQLGAVTWSPLEKEKFFVALDRAGRHDAAGIAERLGGSKSELEVRQYLALLEQASRARQEDASKRDRRIRPVDIPAAAEISADVCRLLEHAADDAGLRVERHEATVERKRWGEGEGTTDWLITPALARFLERRTQAPDEDGEPGEPVLPTIAPDRRHHHHDNNNSTRIPSFAEIFITPNWLKLQDRVFMNSAVPDHNWHFYSEEPPSVRATALDDLYTTGRTVLQRLVATALHVASSRIAAKSGAGSHHPVRPLVKAKDVRAAAASLGLPENSRDFWARSARRLRLDVCRDDEAPGEDEADPAAQMVDEEVDRDGKVEGDNNNNNNNIMSHREVEEALGLGVNSSKSGSEEDPYDSSPSPGPDEAGGPTTRVLEEDTQDPSPNHDSDDDNSSSSSSSSSSPSSSSSSADELDDNDDDDAIIDQAAVDRDLAEALDASEVERDLDEALEHGEALVRAGATARGRAAVRNRIEVEHLRELECEARDARRSRAEEDALLQMLDLGVVKHGDKVTRRIDDDAEAEHLEAKGKGKDKFRRSAGFDEVVDGTSGGGGGVKRWDDELEYRREWEV